MQKYRAPRTNPISRHAPVPPLVKVATGTPAMGQGTRDPAKVRRARKRRRALLKPLPATA